MMDKLENVAKSAQDEESLKNGVPKNEPKNIVKGKRGRKSKRDKAAPRPPYSGYIRYLNDRREQFRAENPNLPFSEITKVLAAEWSQLPAVKKQIYLLAAEQDRVKYVKELTAYKKTDAYQNFIQRKLNRKKVKTPKKEDQEIKKEKPSNDISNSVHNILIYSEEFLTFNKARESELRYLRKSVIDQEQEVSVLDKHIENINSGILKLMDSNNQLQESCLKYEQRINKLKSKLLTALASIKFPGNVDPPTTHTIDNFIVKLATCLNTISDPSLVASVKKAVSSIDISQF